MTKRLWSIRRKLATAMTAGVLLQAGGCADNEIVTGWLTAMFSSVLQDLVYSSFNLI